MERAVFILAIIAGYFAVWLLVSWLSSKGADNSTFFSGNRKMAWPLVAIAMLGAPITGVTFISVPGMVIGKGYSYLQMGLGFIVGYLIISFVLVPLYYKLNIVSIYEYLQRRFGQATYKTGAGLFFVSKILGISVRFLIVCAMLQLLVFDALGIPLFFSVLVSLVFVWLSTYKGGVKSVIWGDVLKSFCLLASIGLCLYFLISDLGWDPSEIFGNIGAHETSRIFFTDDPSDGKFLWKQFIAGIFLVIAMTGLDQDMMQRTLACRDAKASRKNMITASLLQVVVITLLLMLGTVMVSFLESRGEMLPDKSDNLFATIAFHEGIPLAVGALFIIGLISATYSSVASALTSMTTTATVDILGVEKSANPEMLRRKRTAIHTGIAFIMAILVIFFFYINSDDAISTVYTLVSYTDGPILGMFAFGIFTRRKVNERLLPAVCLSAPVIAWGIQWVCANYFGYTIGYELLLLNSGLTFLGMRLIAQPKKVAAPLPSQA